MYTLLDKLWISHFYTGNAQCKLSMCVLCSTCVCCTLVFNLVLCTLGISPNVQFTLGISPIVQLYAGNFPKHIQIKVMYSNDCLLDKLSVQCLHM